MMKIIGIIPARYASTRFPAKSLALLGDKSIVQRVYEQVAKSKLVSKVVVATDHHKIYDHVLGFGGRVVMTGEHHQSGTDRCLEAVSLQKEEYDYAINIQGDEPFIAPEQIDMLAKALDGTTEIATLKKQIINEEQLFDPNVVKVICNQENQALYFSRQTLPYLRGLDKSKWLETHYFFKHLGIYAYRVDILKKIAGLSPSNLEKAESLEQLRWLENQYTIRVLETNQESIGIDTPQDLEAAKKLL